MYRDIRLHGFVDRLIEYYAIAAGSDSHQRYFFSSEQGDEGALRFFSPGNEFIIATNGIEHRGNGGSFCEYMFGVDQPVSDLAKGDVVNRLVMYGTHSDDRTGSLRIGERTEGSITFEKIFFDGNAVCNYFFFVHDETLGITHRAQQEELLRRFGKLIKRSPAIADADDNQIIADLLSLLRGPHAQLFLFKLIHMPHQEYSDLFRSFYLRNKRIADEDFATLTALAARHNIDRYQQERIRIDVMYKHPDNRRIVDEYRNILLSGNRKGEISTLDNARLTRLKTLSVRNKIPGALFYTLDELLRKERHQVDVDEADYIAETRQILEGLFLGQQVIENRIDRDDILKLLNAKKKATEHRNHGFEEILLEVSKSCDENIRDGADISLLEEFSGVITYLDRYDATSQTLNQLAFMENVRVTEEILRSIVGNQREFESLKPDLFRELFIDGILENKYLGNYGRKKITTLLLGVQQVEQEQLTIADLLAQLLAIDGEERLFLLLLKHVRDRIKNFYSKYATKADQEFLKQEVADELRAKKLLKRDIPADLFQETVLTIKKEAIYLHNLLPQIIAEKAITLREDFLENSGLDRFYVEELEREYVELNNIPRDVLYQIRQGLN
ncbi:TIGR04442 family protein [Geobacter argillaceus]|uniref:Uncharacterized protein (TIGR04442 family) n=1 Tax=Geobacter argillaceus TaxID=345631 RepID=A0A562WRT0_9BACT|nr:TIGR04442 family protein [Geobacter argillaceus]TWJ32527.1 uncharacterized protein (TIGR04442 family) [Geobacter argillaceus]